MKNLCKGTGAKFNTHNFLIVSFIFFISISFPFLHPGLCIASEVYAKAAILIDNTNEAVLYAKNPDLKLPPASTTKIVTAMVALDSLDPDSLVTFSKRAANTPSVAPRLKAGQTMQAGEVLSLALMRSVNGAAVALAEAAAGSEANFVVLMNKKVRALGVHNTKFINASGLPGRGQYTTARDISTLLKEALKYPLIEEIVGTRVKMLEVNNKPVLIKNTNYMLWLDDNQIGGKTGYTRAARHCFVAASRIGDRTIIVALLGERRRNNLWLDAKNLLRNYVMVSDNNNRETIQRVNYPVPRENMKGDIGAL